jgi:hypothetical protein
MSQEHQRRSGDLPRAIAAAPWSFSRKIATSDRAGALASGLKSAVEVVCLAILLSLTMLLITGCASAVGEADARPSPFHAEPTLARLSHLQSLTRIHPT